MDKEDFITLSTFAKHTPLVIEALWEVFNTLQIQVNEINARKQEIINNKGKNFTIAEYAYIDSIQRAHSLFNRMAQDMLDSIKSGIGVSL